MYRNIILDFLSNKHLQLAEQNYYQMTICQIGCNYEDSPLKFIKKEDEINIYHIKEPRIYYKNYDFSNLNSSIIMMLMEIKDEIKFNKNELNFEMIDPYYLQNLENQDFVSLQATPIIQNDDLVGAVITYYKKENGSIKFSNNELIKLLNSLTNDRINDFNNTIDDLTEKNNEYYKVIMKDNNYYLNDNAKKKLNISENLINIREIKHPEKILSFIRQHGMKKINYDNLNIYFMDVSKLSSKKINTDVCAMYNINDHGFSSSFSYIIVRNSPLSLLKDTIKNVVDWLNKFEDIEFKIYEYNDETIIVLLNNKITKHDFEYLKETFKNDYLQLLRSPNEITSNMNLKRLSDYLYNIQPEKFDYQDYIDWITKYSEEGLSYSDKFKDFEIYYNIVNVDGVTSLGYSNFLPLRAIYRDSHFISYKSIVEKELLRLSRQERNDYFINIPYTLLKKRKTYEDIKKLLNAECKIWLNIIYDGNDDYNEFVKIISKYKKFNLKTSCDSSVYLNFYLMSSLDLFDAIYIQNEEYNHIRANQVGLPQAIFQYAIKDYKYLIIENFNPNPDLDYNHSNCYYVLKSKNK